MDGMAFFWVDERTVFRPTSLTRCLQLIVGNCIEVAMIGPLYYHELSVTSHENRTREG
jgi:hypothetical protein